MSGRKQCESKHANKRKLQGSEPLLVTKSLVPSPLVLFRVALGDGPFLVCQANGLSLHLGKELKRKIMRYIFEVLREKTVCWFFVLRGSLLYANFVVGKDEDTISRTLENPSPLIVFQRTVRTAKEKKQNKYHEIDSQDILLLSMHQQCRRYRAILVDRSTSRVFCFFFAVVSHHVTLLLCL
jgi:hypothetical protein